MQFPVMIFAAGFGTRMKHLTQDRPKPLIEVAGKPLIDHAVDLAAELPASRIVANLHYRAGMLEKHLAGRAVATIAEAPEILETGGGLRNALPLLGTETVMTLNSDAVWKGSNPLAALQAAWQPDHMDALLMTVPPARAIGYTRQGDFQLNAEGQARRGPGLVYTGAQIIKTDLLHGISETSFSLNVIWDLMIAQNRLYCVEYEGKWCDVGHPEGIPLAEEMLRAPNI